MKLTPFPFSIINFEAFSILIIFTITSCTSLNFPSLSNVLIGGVGEGNGDIFDFFCRPPLFQATFGECEERREASVKFLLYTRNDPHNPYSLVTNDLDNLRRSPFLLGRKIKMLIHGYVGSPHHPFPAVTRDAYLRLGGDLSVNVISLDWRAAASGGIGQLTRPYPLSVGCTFGVARKTADLIKFLLRNNYITLDNLHIVGHSLGSHLAALVGQEFNGNISRITGLDPSRPCFRRGDTGYAYRIGPDVAKFVDIIHTDGEVGRGLGTGLNDKLGHQDFFPNGGFSVQPGCRHQFLTPDGGCSHGRAPQLFAESIENPLAFVGRRCDSWTLFQNGQCNRQEEAVMGEYAQPNYLIKPANFYLRTGSNSPFGLGSSGSIDSPSRNGR